MVALLVLHIEGLAQDCSNSIANALELLQSCTKPSICIMLKPYHLIQVTDFSRWGVYDFYSFEYWGPFQHEDHLTRYRDFLYKDKTIVRPSYLYKGYDYTAYVDYMDPDVLCPQKGR